MLLKSFTIASATFLSLEQITLKLAFLLASMTSHRLHTLHILDIPRMSTITNGVQFVITGSTETSLRGYHPQPIYLEKVDRKTLRNNNIKRTRDLRGQRSNVFITFSKPHKAAMRATLARWIRRQ